MEETIKFFPRPVVKVEPVDGKIVLKEHHFKYCECEVGKAWTGSSETECHGDDNFKLIRKTANEKIFKCPKSGLTIVILKSTKEELKEADEMGSKYLRIPEENLLAI